MSVGFLLGFFGCKVLSIEDLIIRSLPDVIVVAKLDDVHVDLAKNWGLLHHELHLLPIELNSFNFLPRVFFLYLLHFDLVVSPDLIFGVSTLKVDFNLESSHMLLVGLFSSLNAAI